MCTGTVLSFARDLRASVIDEERLRVDHSKMIRGVRSVTGALAVLLALGCGGRYSLDGDSSAGAGRTSATPDGGAPTVSAGGAGNGPAGAAGAPSAGAAGTPPQGACRSTRNGMPSSPTPQNVSGEYQLVTCGQATRCTQVGEPAMTRTLSDPIRMRVMQDPNHLALGTVTLDGTGELLLDGRAFNAEFTGRSFEVELSGPINAVCNEEYDLSFSYDFDGYGPRTFSLNFERSPTCSGNNGSEYCKGNIVSTFGDAVMVPQ